MPCGGRRRHGSTASPQRTGCVGQFAVDVWNAFQLVCVICCEGQDGQEDPGENREADRVPTSISCYAVLHLPIVLTTKPLRNVFRAAERDVVEAWRRREQGHAQAGYRRRSENVRNVTSS